MEHTFKIEKELKITTENIVDCVLSCEAGGFDYWGELCSDEKDYEAARQRLAEREKAERKIITRTTSTSTTEFLLTALCSMRFSAT